MKDELEGILARTRQALAGLPDLKAAEDLKTRVLGRKGELTELLHGLKDVPAQDRPALGQAANRIKEELAKLFSEHETRLKQVHLEKDDAGVADPTLPGRPAEVGRLHLIPRVAQEIEDIFTTMGFAVAEGPEVETDYYNFTALNFPADHPARDMHDTFFVSGQVLLRTHMSPVQIRLMEKQKPPIRAIMPGKAYRHDDDATHSPMFHQVEGLMVAPDVSFADLKAVLTLFVQRMFRADAKLRFRPSYFPFTEPSAEIDMTCVKCGGQGCALCKGSGWIEILGAGMVHPAVLTAGGVDPKAFTGFAFGMGVERVAMLKYGIDNMRYFFENDLRFLEQV